jgi:hypothetical protein
MAAKTGSAPESSTDYIASIQSIISNDPIRWQILRHVHRLGLPDCWVGAGFVRNAVWDHLHGRPTSPLSTDVDVIWFDEECCSALADRQAEATLRDLDQSIDWSVKNQARMHLQNSDRPYLCSVDAMRYWPETATAVAVRLGNNDVCEVAAPLGLDDLFQMIIRPTSRFTGEKQHIFQQRMISKNWLATWPLLKFSDS